MNKDFFNKQISFKDIKINKDTFKNIKNKKEIFISILVVIYIFVICFIGNNLLNTRKEKKEEYLKKYNQCEIIKKYPSIENINSQIEKLNLDKEKLITQVAEIQEVNDSAKIIKEFKDNAPIKWEKENISINRENKDFQEYEILTIRISSFSGTYKQIEDFLEYVKNYNKIVRVNSLAFKENTSTGKLTGEANLSFYFKKSNV